MAPKSSNMLKFLKKHKYKISFVVMLAIIVAVFNFVIIPEYKKYQERKTMKLFLSNLEPNDEESTFQHPLDVKKEND